MFTVMNQKSCEIQIVIPKNKSNPKILMIDLMTNNPVAMRYVNAFFITNNEKIAKPIMTKIANTISGIKIKPIAKIGSMYFKFFFKKRKIPALIPSKK